MTHKRLCRSTTWASVMCLRRTVMTRGHIYLSGCSSVTPLLHPVSWNVLLPQLHPFSQHSLSLRVKQGCVESNYTPGTALCPLQFDDGDNHKWILTASHINILAHQPFVSPVHLNSSVKFRFCLYFTMLPHIFPLFYPPFHFTISEWTNYCLLHR